MRDYLNRADHFLRTTNGLLLEPRRELLAAQFDIVRRETNTAVLAKMAEMIRWSKTAPGAESFKGTDRWDGMEWIYHQWDDWENWAKERA